MRSVVPALDEASRRSRVQAFGELERFLAEAGEARLTLAEIERGAEPRGRELLRLLLQAHIDARGDGDVGDAIIVQLPEGPVRLGYKRRYARPVLTLFGEVRVTRMGLLGAGAPGDLPIGSRAQAARADLQLRMPAAAAAGRCLLAV
jgi:hypothetical protein